MWDDLPDTLRADNDPSAGFVAFSRTRRSKSAWIGCKAGFRTKGAVDGAGGQHGRQRYYSGQPDQRRQAK
jgi:hypothetical protein